MKINFTKKEYRLLTDMLYLADWVMNSHDETHSINQAYSDLRKKILSHCKEMGLDNQFHYSDGEYYETGDSEFELHEKFLDGYNEETFWDQLIDKLSTRDFVKKVGVNEYQKMDGEKRLSGITEFEHQYIDEFNQHGLDNLKVTRS
jgi:hypothetical protein